MVATSAKAWAARVVSRRAARLVRRRLSVPIVGSRRRAELRRSRRILGRARSRGSATIPRGLCDVGTRHRPPGADSSGRRARLRTELDDLDEAARLAGRGHDLELAVPSASRMPAAVLSSTSRQVSTSELQQVHDVVVVDERVGELREGLQQPRSRESRSCTTSIRSSLARKRESALDDRLGDIHHRSARGERLALDDEQRRRRPTCRVGRAPRRSPDG